MTRSELAVIMTAEGRQAAAWARSEHGLRLECAFAVEVVSGDRGWLHTSTVLRLYRGDLSLCYHWLPKNAPTIDEMRASFRTMVKNIVQAYAIR